MRSQTNILVDARGLARLTDFGLVVVLHNTNSLTGSTGAAAGGTARWMAPELLTGSDSQHRESSDSYAAAIVFWQASVS